MPAIDATHRPGPWPRIPCCSSTTHMDCTSATSNETKAPAALLSNGVQSACTTHRRWSNVVKHLLQIHHRLSQPGWPGADQYWAPSSIVASVVMQIVPGKYELSYEVGPKRPTLVRTALHAACMQEVPCTECHHELQKSVQTRTTQWAIATRQTSSPQSPAVASHNCNNATRWLRAWRLTEILR